MIGAVSEMGARFAVVLVRLYNCFYLDLPPEDTRQAAGNGAR
jgi:hypothetical protein